MSDDKQYTLKACSQEELAVFNKRLGDLLNELDLDMRVQPTFVPETSTNKFLVDCQVVVYKKVEMQLVEKEHGPKEAGPNEDGPVNNENKASEQSQEEDKPVN